MDTAIEVAEHAAAVPGGTLYIRSWQPRAGAPERAPIVLLHDSIGCVEMWREFPRALARQLKRSVIAYDRLGFGRSSARRDLPSIGFVNEEAEIGFAAVKEQLKIREFAVFGHSVGGGMAVVIAARYPQACRAVITESAQSFVEEITLKSIAQSKTRFAQPQELAKLERFHGDKTRWVLSAWTDTWLSPQFADWNLRSELARVQSPLLAIHGDRDEYGTIAFPEELCSLSAGPAEKLIVPDCGHVPHREKEGLIVQAVERFLHSA